MRTAARFFIIASFVVWIGGIVFFSFVVAPAAFSQLASDSAVRLVRICLNVLHFTGIVCGVILLIATWVVKIERVTTLRAILGLMLLCTIISQFGVTRQIEKIRANVGGSIQALPPQDAGRAAFDRLHQISVGLESIVLLAGLGAIAVLAADRQQ